jgi:BirA family biotin operon repressor/biotin-[acetyl-CoA-carboxylase] ligase
VTVVRPSPYSDLDRPPLSASRLRQALITPDGFWTDLVLHAETGSTNADAAAAARAGAAEGLVVVAERQNAGRGRLDRQWVSPPRAGLTLSVVLKPPSRYQWLPLLAGVALVETVRRLGEVDAVLKWPNDLLIDGRKCAGILAESVGESVVLGIGLNVTLREPELPRPDATSLLLAGSTCVDRDPLLRALLRTLAGWYLRWRDAAGDPETSGLREAYRVHCGTLGQAVRVALPDGSQLVGTASDVDGAGRLVVTGPDGVPTAVAAGDIEHVR